MTFKPGIWYPIAIVLSVGNLAGVGFAAAAAEPWHATIHATLAVVCGLWAHRLRRSPGGGDLQARFEALEAEVGRLGQELSETQERLDFAERVLAQAPETRQVGPQR